MEATKKGTDRLKDLGVTIYAFALLAFVLGCIGFFVWAVTPDSIKYPIYYGLEYSIDSSQVHFNKEPTDCDWEHAPIGNKDCHYEKQVYPVNNATGTVTDVYVTWAKTAD